MKRKLLFGCLVVFLFATIALDTIKKSPVEIVEAAMDKVRTGDVQRSQLKQEDIDKIRSFYQFADEEKLGRPRVEVKEVTNSGDKAQVLAAFEIIDYDHHNQIRAIYAGNLVFTLRNVSFLAWEVQGVEVKRKMEAQ